MGLDLAPAGLGRFPVAEDVEMMNDTTTATQTQNGSFFNVDMATLGNGRGAERRYPRLRLLYHTDLDRIGAVTAPNLILSRGDWVTVGRRAPMFFETCEEGMERPIGDPTISRSQFKVRWVEEAGCFELKCLAEAKRRIGVVLPGEPGEWDEQGIDGVREVRGVMRVPPGSCVAIEDRALIGLDHAPVSSFGDVDRLGLVGESGVMWRLRQEIVGVAEFQEPALILGPTGSGKELVSRAICQLSRRAEEPFVMVNCAALPDHLVESILFGHVKGAFTGAESNRVGHFRAADGGTIFLDELGEMPSQVQPKLLRAVQDGQITPVGQQRPLQVDVRLIAATNRDPIAEIKAHRLREDLYHRLSAHIIRTPPLATRSFDIPELFMYFLRQLRSQHSKLDWLWADGERWRPTIPLGFFVKLMAGAWSGNVRQLQNAAARTARQNIGRSTFSSPELLDLVRTSPGLQPHPAPATPAPTLAPATPSEPSIIVSEGDDAEHDDEQLAAASDALNLARKTVAKLVAPDELDLLWQKHQGDPDAFSEALHVAAADNLLNTLAQHDFKQRNVAADLDISPSTLVKLMRRLKLPRAKDFNLATIEAAIDDADGDVDAAALKLRVSSLGLKKRLTLLRLKNKR